ncbi:transcriptional regulator, TetR family [Actinoalloteichus fjordicus]|uniref:Transcriptional regulator, TetR family n=2 Tax=Actinoalloteichus fjordicus TaxID=1612552 RepID=A0AAC9LF08_9PSEU|nr:transcriptional regulator, TetR family [Actinoalloteichus fjordicus]
MRHHCYDRGMPRWDPRAEERLGDAALELFVEHGYENVTVEQITERAGLTRRTFSRYFTDKRDVLFAGSEQIPGVLSGAVRRADAALPPFQALLVALVDIGEWFADLVPHAARRRAVIASSPELQERERTKLAAVTDALAEALRERGTPTSRATLLAQVGIAVFRTAFERWTDEPEPADFAARVREAATELAASLAPAAGLATVVPEDH